jgi:hypothetical protein
MATTSVVLDVVHGIFDTHYVSELAVRPFFRIVLY